MDENTEEFEGKNSISADLIRGHINTIILRSLYERDKYGYEIRAEINEKSHGQYTLKEPTLYSALKRLENQGYIQAYYKRDETSAGGRRKYFRLTDSGKEIAEHNRSEWEYSRTVIDSLISDKNFDFSQPAPTPVDFKILKQATSRVPVVHTESEEKPEGAADEKPEGQPAEPQTTYVAGQSETVYIDGEQAGISRQTAEIDQSDAPAESGKAETAAGSPHALPQQAAEAAEPAQTSAQQAANTAPAEQALQGNSYTSQLNTSEEAEARRIAHENYLKLIAGDDGTARREAVNEERSPIYSERPEQERDYKNIIEKLFDNTLKNAPPPAPQPKPEPGYEPSPAPAREHTAVPAHYDYMDVTGKAAGDGLKINTSEEALTSGTVRQATYNRGATLFKCSLIIGVIILLEFTLTMLFRQDLHVSIAYPIVILSLGLATILVCGILYGTHYGSRMRKPISLKYIFTASILTVLLMAIIVLFALVLRVNWSSSTDVLAKVVIPCIIALNIPIFALSFYLFTK
ncbi:MAG TPA: helix-turn-helix transcriptional regulator [Candidatus Coproplasma avistercoris]|nr:helix-turn-helix transcriptional regulator [Candidatus Coproplasma avistercoris]